MEKRSKNKIINYFYHSWVQTCGEGWTGKQVLTAYLFSLLFPILIVLYSFYADLQWNWIQMTAAVLLAWDLSGGVLGYNHASIKRRQAGETSRLHFFHHNLQHIHPLLLIFFNHQLILLAGTLYWFISFLLYVEFLEINPRTKQRKLSRTGERIVIVFELIAAAFLITLSFLVPDINAGFRIYGITLYALLPFLTLLLINVPLVFQRTFSIMLVIIMILIGMLLKTPPGFEWLLPVYFLKLLVGFTAKEQVAGS